MVLLLGTGQKIDTWFTPNSIFRSGSSGGSGWSADPPGPIWWI